jgi:hypothetical protein
MGLAPSQEESYREEGGDPKRKSLMEPRVWTYKMGKKTIGDSKPR